MNALTNLKTFLNNVGATGITQVFLELNEVINGETPKTYPFVFWDMDTIKFVESFRKDYRRFSIRVAVVSKWVREEELPGNPKIAEWDDLLVKFKAYITYLESIKSSYSYGFVNLDKVAGEYFDRGIVSIDEEIAISFTMEIEAFC